MRTALAGLAALALATALVACAPPTTKSSPETPPAAAAAEEEGGAVAEAALAVASVPTGQYSAVSRTATSATGDLTLADNALTFARAQTYRTERVGVIEASQEHAPGAGTLAERLNIPPGTGMEVRRVTASEIGSGAPRGGLCGADTVTFVAIAAATDNTNMPALWIAAFKGPNAPGGGQGAHEDFCAFYTYAPASL